GRLPGVAGQRVRRDGRLDRATAAGADRAAHGGPAGRLLAWTAHAGHPDRAVPGQLTYSASQPSTIGSRSVNCSITASGVPSVPSWLAGITECGISTARLPTWLAP